MTCIAARFGALSMGVIGGLIGTLLLINVVFAGHVARPAVKMSAANWIAGPPPLALRLSSDTAYQVYLPIILNSP